MKAPSNGLLFKVSTVDTGPFCDVEVEDFVTRLIATGRQHFRPNQKLLSDTATKNVKFNTLSRLKISA